MKGKIVLVCLLITVVALSGCVSDEEHNSKINYSCVVDEDCAIKPVGCDICYGLKQGCVNKDSIEGICSRMELGIFATTCQALTPIPSSCYCENNVCVSGETLE